MNRRYQICFNILAVVFLSILVPTLFCITMWGNTMDYNLATKLLCSCGNKRILLYSGMIVFLSFIFIYLSRKVLITKKTSVILSMALGALFILLFVWNIKICECINIAQGWDVSCVVGGAYRLNKGGYIADDTYFSVYPNNVPITFILYRLFQFADGLDNFKYVQDFMWILVICAMVSVTGYVSCIIVKKLTNSFSLTIVAAFIYFVIMLLTPWKTTPYTDMFSMMFPVLSLNLYVLYRLSQRKWLKYTLWFFCIGLGLLGAMIKITVAIVLITILICEAISNLPEIRKQKKELLIKLGLIVLAVLLYWGLKNHIYNVTQYTPNKEASMKAVHYLMMGLNEESTGSYSSEDYGYSCSFDTQKERIPAQFKKVGERLKEKGILGYPKFVVTKMVMTFNDGTFGWGREGSYNYPYPIYSTNKELIDNIQAYFLPDAVKSTEFGTHSQTIWFVIIFSLPGVCLVSNKEKEKYMPLLLSIVGMILYLILFEARARYMICFLPVLIVTAVIGIGQYYRMLTVLVHKCIHK